MARLPWIIRTLFESSRNYSHCSRKQRFSEIFLFHHEVVRCMYSLESHHHRGDSNEYTQHTVIV